MFDALIDMHLAPGREGGLAGFHRQLDIVGIAIWYIRQWFIVSGINRGVAFTGAALHPLATDHHFPALGFLLGHV